MTSKCSASTWSARVQDVPLSDSSAPRTRRGYLPPGGQMKRILLVDDDPAILRAYARALARDWDAVPASDGASAIAQLRAGDFDAIVSDVAMPGMGGLEFLRAVRALDLDVPVILMTGTPGLDSAMRAVEYGAFRYLEKPVAIEALGRHASVRRPPPRHGAAEAERVGRGRYRTRAPRRPGGRLEATLRDGSTTLLYGISTDRLAPHADCLYGFEALLRCNEPTLPSPCEVLLAAERLGHVHELGRAIRNRVAEEGHCTSPRGREDLLVNLHPLDLNDEHLYTATSGLSKIAPRI